MIGDAGFGVFAPRNLPEVGWTLARDAWGRGYATEAARACVEAAWTARGGRAFSSLSPRRPRAADPRLLVTAGMFAGLAVVGATTSFDITA